MNLKMKPRSFGPECLQAQRRLGLIIKSIYQTLDPSELLKAFLPSDRCFTSAGSNPV